MMKKKRSSVIIFMMIFSLVLQLTPIVHGDVLARLINMGFEDGIQEWNTSGTVTIESHRDIPVDWDFDKDDINDIWKIDRKDNLMAVLKPSGQTGIFPKMSTDLRLSQKSKDYITGLFPAITDAAYIYRDLELQAGDEFSIGWNYVGTDYEPYNDASFVSLVNIDNPSNMPIVNEVNAEVSVLGATVRGTGNFSTGSYGSTGWQLADFKILSQGTYRLGLAVYNLKDTAYPPYLFVDDGQGLTYLNDVEFAPILPDGKAPPPPATAITVNGNPTDWTNQNSTISFTTNEEAGNIVSVSVVGSLSGNMTVSENAGTYSFIADKNEYFTITVLNDQGGQAFAGVNVKKIDKASPSLSKVSINPASWTQSSATVTITAVDTGSGIALSNAYSFDDGVTWQNANTKVFSSNTTGIKVKVKDAVGNISESTVVDITKIDKTAPIIQSVAGNPSAWQNTDVTLTVTAADTDSGIAPANAYSFDGGATWQNSNYGTVSTDG